LLVSLVQHVFIFFDFNGVEHEEASQPVLKGLHHATFTLFFPSHSTFQSDRRVARCKSRVTAMMEEKVFRFVGISLGVPAFEVVFL
jgi:hypothetical protein